MVQVVARNKRESARRMPAANVLRSLRWWRLGVLCVLLAACAWPRNPALREPAADNTPAATATIAAPMSAQPSVPADAVPERAPSVTAEAALPSAAGRVPRDPVVRPARPAAGAAASTTQAAVDDSPWAAEPAPLPVPVEQPSTVSAAPAQHAAAAAPMPPATATLAAATHAVLPSAWQWHWLLWVLLALAAVAALITLRHRRRSSRPAPPAPRANASPSIRRARLAPDAAKTMLTPPQATRRRSVALLAADRGHRHAASRSALAVAPVSPTTMEHPHVPSEPLPTQPQPQPPVPAAAQSGTWVIEGTHMTLQMEWAASRGEQMIWQDWMEPAPVDMGDGCLLVHEGVALDPVETQLQPGPQPPVQPEPAMSPAVVAAPAAATAVAAEPVVPAAAVVAAPPAAAPVQPVEPAAATVPFARRVQALLDDTAGAGLFRVELGTGSDAPQLRLLVPALPAAASAALFKGIALMNSPDLARWLQAQVALASRFEMPGNKPERVYEHAVELTMAPAQSASPNAADWQALRIQLHLAWLQQQGRASRLLGLSRMRQALAELDQAQSLPVQLAWLQVLQWWGGQQQGAAGLQRYDEAEAVCVALASHPEMEHESQRLLAETLLLRSRQEIGGIREAGLRRAAELAGQVHAQTQLPAAALSVAGIALARAELATPAAALPLLEQALAHAFIAGQEPALEAASLQARLAVQLAYEALVNEPAPQQVAQDLAERLQGTALLAAETWRRIVDVHLRREQFQQACQVAAQAARQHRLRPDLIALWERASAAWKAQGLRDGAQTAWQENVRARQAASAQV